MDILGPEPEDKAYPRTNLHVARRLHATTEQKASSPSPVQSGRHVREPTVGLWSHLWSHPSTFAYVH
jgi:hypothetical protein